MTNKLLRFFKILGLTLLVLYGGLCALLYFNQDDLLFHPQPKSMARISEILTNHPDFDTLTIVMKDGNRTCGYASRDTSPEKLPLVLYFGGNAEEVSHLMDKKDYFPNTQIVLINYRGFGLSQGQISEQTMFSDALEVYDKMMMNPKLDAGHVFVIGRSIGTGVATYLSAQRNVKATILITPYDNMCDVAFEKYPFVPIQILLKHPFRSNTYAKQIHTPMLALISANDEVIPKHHAYKLMKSWKGQTTSLEVIEDHNSIMDNQAVWQKIKEFIQGNNK